ncbi:S8 family peptidase [Persephonella sp.]
MYFYIFSLIFLLLTRVNAVDLGFVIYKKGEKIIKEPVHRIYILEDPDDEYYPFQEYLSLIKVNDIWKIFSGSEGIYVGIIDTGVDFKNPDLRDNIWINPDEICDDRKDNDNNGYVDDCYGWNAIDGKGSAYDDNGHGTALAGIIGAVGNNKIGVAGINWKIKIIPCKALDRLGEGLTVHANKCIEYFLDLKREKGLNVIAVNASFGGEYECYQIIDGEKVSDQCEEKRLIEELGNQGILFVTAAGNAGKNNDSISMLPCNYNLPNKICVGSLSPGYKRSYFSNYGSTVDIFAVGENVYTLSLNGYCKYGAGTSYAAAVVTGSIALISGYYNNQDIYFLKEKIINGSRNNIDLSGFSSSCNMLDLQNIVFIENNRSLCFSKNSISISSVSEDYVKLSNTGTAPVKIVDVYVTDPAKIGFVEDSCKNAVLVPGESCSIGLKIVSDLIGVYQEELVIEGDLKITLPVLLSNNVNTQSTEILSGNIEGNIQKCVEILEINNDPEDNVDSFYPVQLDNVGCYMGSVQYGYGIVLIFFVIRLFRRVFNKA